MPAEVKPIDREKVLFKMDKQLDRFPEEYKKDQVSLNDLINDDRVFKGTDLVDVSKAYEATKPHQSIPDFDKMKSQTKFRIDMPKDPYKADESEERPEINI